MCKGMAAWDSSTNTAEPGSSCSFRSRDVLLFDSVSKKEAEEKERIEKKVSAFWRAGLNNPSSVTREQCRDIQDCIYTLRSKRPLVPDRWHDWLRDRYQIDMQSAVAELKSAAEQTLEDE